MNSMLLPGCASKQEPIYITKLVFPDLAICSRPEAPLFIKYRRSEDLDSIYNFNAWTKNQISQHVYEKDLNAVIDCYELQVHAVKQKQQEVEKNGQSNNKP